MISTRLFLTATAALILVGCGGGDSSQDAGKTAAQPKAGPATSAAATAKASSDNRAHAVNLGKPGAGANVSYEIKGRPQAGVPVDIELVLTATVETDSLEATVNGMDGLHLGAGPSSVSGTNLGIGDEVRGTVTVIPQRNGIFYASVVVKSNGATGLQARTFAIPLVVGNVQAERKPSTATTDAAGERIKSMPAKEGDR
jgi:hypothetical protein